MCCLYQKDERALPGNLQNRKYRFFLSYSPPDLVSLTTPHFFLLSLTKRKGNATTKQRLVKTDDFLCAVVTVIFGVCNSLRLS
jgi:hypothetical protein